jgi:putative transcriptional regulator
MIPQNPGSLKGYFLIAMPGLMDINFQKTVTLISEHTAEGAVGIVINQTHAELQTKNIFQELGIDFVDQAGHIPIHIGGPVHTNEIFILHGQPVEWGESLLITPELALSNTKIILEAIAHRKGPDSYIISLGCAGWGPGQLEYEIKENVWLTAPYTRDIIFELPMENRWEESMKRIGIDPTLLSDSVGHA